MLKKIEDAVAKSDGASSDANNGAISPDGASADSERKGGMRRLNRPQEVPSMALIKESTREKYHVVYRDIFQDGALDRRTKELIAIGVAASSGCQGCLIGHIRKARAMGVTMEEVKEIIGVAFAVNAATVVDHTDVVAAIMGLPRE